MTTVPQVHIFHFRCPLCGAKADELSLSEAAELWGGASKQRVQLLASSVISAVHEARSGNCRWMTKKFGRACEALDETYQALFSQQDQNGVVVPTKAGEEHLLARIDCPLCQAFRGPRLGDSYFTAWNEACKIQISNITYEAALVLWCVLRSVPEGWTGEDLSKLDALRIALYKTGLATGSMVCPQCGRPVTCLFGGGPEDDNSYCRHCHDMAGGTGGVSIQIGVNQEGEPFVQMSDVDASAPAQCSKPLFPPDIRPRRPQSH